MNGLFEEITQDLFAPELDIMGVQRMPQFMGRYQVSNRMDNALAHLVASDGQHSRLLGCDSAGILTTYDDAAHTHLSMMDAKLSGSGALRIKDDSLSNYATVDSSGNQYVTVCYAGTRAEIKTATQVVAIDTGLVVSSWHLLELYTMFLDCYDAVNHYLKVHETA